MAEISKTVIANMALGHLGVTDSISDLDTERSEEARTIRRFYDVTLRALARDFQWPFLDKLRDLSLVEEDEDADWVYRYRYPSDCLEARRIPSGQSVDGRYDRVPFKLGNDDSGLLILTNQDEATLEYTVSPIGKEDMFPPDFVMAFSYRLAMVIAPSVAGQDSVRLAQAARTQYLFELGRSQAVAVNEVQPRPEPEADSIRARG